MAASPINRVLRHARRASLIDGDLTDAQFLDCFIARRDEAAFEALVRRHGPMVLGVCRRIAGHVENAEDAFQAVFLVLARNADCVVPRDVVGNWLYGVACRTALKARGKSAKWRSREKQVVEMPQPTVEPETE
jgi:RNA polymerase sigma-70 factor (ECF subfamily)